MCLVDFSQELLIRTVGNVETPQLQIFMAAFAQRHIDAKEMRVTTPAGTDVSFELDPNHLVCNDCGNATVPGMHMLTGQLNIVPRFGTINGKIVFRRNDHAAIRQSTVTASGIDRREQQNCQV